MVVLLLLLLLLMVVMMMMMLLLLLMITVVQEVSGTVADVRVARRAAVMARQTADVLENENTHARAHTF